MSMPITMTEEALRRLPDDDLRHMRDMLREAVSDGGPYARDWNRLLGRVLAELGRRYGAASAPPPLRLVSEDDGVHVIPDECTDDCRHTTAPRH